MVLRVIARGAQRERANSGADVVSKPRPPDRVGVFQRHAPQVADEVVPVVVIADPRGFPRDQWRALADSKPAA